MTRHLGAYNFSGETENNKSRIKYIVDLMAMNSVENSKE